MDLYFAIKELFPQAEAERDFVLQSDGGGQYIKEWNLKDATGNPIPQPTQAELEGAYQSYLQKKALTEYRVRRAREYPSLGDQLDCIWKALKALGIQPDAAAGANTPEGMLSLIESIKQKYPKPQGV